tara:strand:- start:1453 stop:1971 length:519 start_codon:yes stop_codon:yes gene_type:complete
MALTIEWSEFLQAHQGLGIDAFLERVTVPYLLVLPANSSLDDSSMGVETLHDLSESKVDALASPAMFRYAIPLAKSETSNPFGHMLTVGRAANNDVVLKSKLVSKFHAYFRQLGTSWSLCDASSSNGTYLNASKLAPERSRPVKSGDQVWFGKEITTVFLLPEALFELLAQG